MKTKKVLSLIITCIFAIMSTSVCVSASNVQGDANGDGVLTVRDAAYIASCLSKGIKLDLSADYNCDGKVNIRDASAIANDLTNPHSSYAKKILKLVNAERAKVGASPLVLNLMLTSAADVRAEEISEYFSHHRPDGSLFSTVFDDLGINYYLCGENIAAGTSDPEMVVRQWINSPAHYENMINPKYTQLGVGYYYDANSTYKYHWSQLFKCE